MTDYTVHQVGTHLSSALAKQIRGVCRAQRCTPFHFYLAAFKALLFSFTDTNDLTIGIADANRNDSEVIDSIGFLLNLLTLRFRRQPDQSFAEAITEARNTAYGALEHSRLPFDILLTELGVTRSPSHSPFFQAFFNYRKQASDREVWCNCDFQLEEMHPGRTAYDISLDVADLGAGVHLTIRTQQSLYSSSATAANLLLDTYTHFLSTLANQVSLPLQDMPLFSDEQLAQGLQVGVGPALVSEWPATLPHRIDQISLSLEHGHQTALMDGQGRCLTYTAMASRIQELSEQMVRAGLGTRSRVLVFQDASVDWVCSMLAIMRIGGVYIPLDLRNPISRLAAQATHCTSDAVLADSTTVTDAQQLGVSVIINVSIVPVSHTSSDSEQLPNQADPEGIAAILYTSGSTGSPKGIVIRHSGILNEMEGYTKMYNLGAERVLQQSAFTFDFSMDQMFTGLVNGGMVYIVPWSKRGDAISITEIMRDQAITYTKVTPSEYSMWLEYGRENLRQALQWRFAFGGGELVSESLLQQFSGLGLTDLRLYNSYGPAEISIASHKGNIDYRRDDGSHTGGGGGPKGGGPISCGHSLPNYATYVLDKDQKPLPVGMPGEVVIGGAGVSLGYLANDELTSRVFVPNPYATPFHIANGWNRMHRTGDIGHLEPDGSLVFRNRVAGDTQIKLRGLRIDLQDVEASMVSTAAGILKEAVVTVREGDPDYLVAHVLFSADFLSDIKAKNQFLNQLLGRLPLPQYMVPVTAIPLDKLPLTNHSKVDRKAIKALALPQEVAQLDDAIQALDYYGEAAELGETIVQLRHVWRQLLPKSHQMLGLVMSPSTSFFHVGGNSLLAIRLQSRILQVFNVALRLVDLLAAHTLGDMASKIRASPNAEPILWNREIAPPAKPGFLVEGHLQQQQGEQKQRPAKTGKTVLVTGATGTLAKHLLPFLFADSRVDQIHCIAVRDKAREGGWPWSDQVKVSAHAGDLSLPLLGLSEDAFRGLAEQVDVVLHLGAVRSFFDNYHTLRATNVLSTKELVKLASVRHTQRSTQRKA